jgi:hypothetical protein
MAQLSALRAGRTLTPGNSLVSFMLEAEWAPGLLNVDRRNRSLENLQGPYWQSKPETFVL